MSVTVKELDAGDAARWDAFVQACDEATFFHRAGWKTVIENSFGQRGHLLYAERDGQIEGILPIFDVKSRLFGHRLVSTAFCVGGAPAVTSDEALAALDRAAEDLMARTGAEYIEYRDPSRPHADWPKKEGLYANFERPTEADEDANLKQIPRKQRAVVRKALKADLVDEIDTDIDRFYGLYSPSMRNLGTPVFGKAYIRNLLDVFGDDCDILTVSQNGRPLSSVLNFYFKDTVLPYYTGADPEARKSGAADLQYFRLMRRAVERGYTNFDFGRSKVDTGPYAFKKNWGFEPRPTVLEFKMKGGAALPDINPNNPKYRFFIDTWKKLPLPVANMIGPWLGKQVG
ncbi:MAG: FemAB family PEP-CTERM system-associated protein [Rhodobacterales bacterium]|nr:FemAB family PEP-CTERM system-associated protein [Rhodobacterales bacterium]